MHEAAKRRLVAELVEAGRRSAKAIECPRCARPVLRGEDDDYCTVTVSVDPEPLDDHADEMLAVLAGRDTYELVPITRKGAGAYALYHRHPWRYLSGKARGTVHASHECERKK